MSRSECSRFVAAVAVLAFVAAPAAQAVDYTWDGDAGSSAWNDPLNWHLDSGFPSASTDTATINDTPTGQNTIDLSGADRTVGVLTFSNASGGAGDYTIADSGGTRALKLGEGTAAPDVVQTGGATNTISAKVVAASGLDIDLDAGVLKFTNANNQVAVGGTANVAGGTELEVTADALGATNIVLGNDSVDGALLTLLSYEHPGGGMLMAAHYDAGGGASQVNFTGSFDPTAQPFTGAGGALADVPAATKLDWTTSLTDDAGIAEFGGGDNFQFVWTGWFSPDVSGSWQFRVTQADGAGGIDDDGSFWIDVDLNDNFAAGEGQATTGEATIGAVLTAGQHYPIAIGFNENGGGENFGAFVKGPAGSELASGAFTDGFFSINPGAQNEFFGVTDNFGVAVADTDADIAVTADATIDVQSPEGKSFRYDALSIAAGQTLTKVGPGTLVFDQGSDANVMGAGAEIVVQEGTFSLVTPSGLSGTPGLPDLVALDGGTLELVYEALTDYRGTELAARNVTSTVLFSPTGPSVQGLLGDLTNQGGATVNFTNSGGRVAFTTTTVSGTFNVGVEGTAVDLGTVDFQNAAGRLVKQGSGDALLLKAPVNAVAGSTYEAREGRIVAIQNTTNPFGVGGIDIAGGEVVLGTSNFFGKTFNTPVTVTTSGTLTAGRAGGVGAAAFTPMVASGTLTVEADQTLIARGQDGLTLDITGPITGDGSFEASEGTVNLKSVAKDYSGRTIASGGTVTVDADLSGTTGVTVSGGAMNVNATISVQGGGGAAPPAGLLGWWRFDEAAGATEAQDVSGNGNTGSLEGDAQSGQPGRSGLSYFFDGAGDGVEIDSVDVSGTSFTLAGWAKRASGGTRDIIFGQGNNGAGGALHAGPTGADGYLYNFFGDDMEGNDPLAAQDDEWHFWTATYRAGDNFRALWIDGDQVDSLTGGTFSAPEDPFLIGRQGYNADGDFHGWIDDVYVFNRELNETEIEALMDLADEALAPIIVTGGTFNINAAGVVAGAGMGQSGGTVNVVGDLNVPVLSVAGGLFNLKPTGDVTDPAGTGDSELVVFGGTTNLEKALGGGNGGLDTWSVDQRGGTVVVKVSEALDNVTSYVARGGTVDATAANAHLAVVDVEAGGTLKLSAGQDTPSGATVPTAAIDGTYAIGTNVGTEFDGVQMGDGSILAAVAGSRTYASDLTLLGETTVTGELTLTGIVSEASPGILTLGEGKLTLDPAAGENTYSDTNVPMGTVVANKPGALGTGIVSVTGTGFLQLAVDGAAAHGHTPGPATPNAVDVRDGGVIDFVAQQDYGVPHVDVLVGDGGALVGDLMDSSGGAVDPFADPDNGGPLLAPIRFEEGATVAHDTGPAPTRRQLFDSGLDGTGGKPNAHLVPVLFRGVTAANETVSVGDDGDEDGGPDDGFSVYKGVSFNPLYSPFISVPASDVASTPFNGTLTDVSLTADGITAAMFLPGPDGDAIPEGLVVDGFTTLATSNTDTGATFIGTGEMQLDLNFGWPNGTDVITRRAPVNNEGNRNGFDVAGTVPDGKTVRIENLAVVLDAADQLAADGGPGGGHLDVHAGGGLDLRTNTPTQGKVTIRGLASTGNRPGAVSVDTLAQIEPAGVDLAYEDGAMVLLNFSGLTINPEPASQPANVIYVMADSGAKNIASNQDITFLDGGGLYWSGRNEGGGGSLTTDGTDIFFSGETQGSVHLGSGEGSFNVQANIDLTDTGGSGVVADLRIGQADVPKGGEGGLSLDRVVADGTVNALRSVTARDLIVSHGSFTWNADSSSHTFSVRNIIGEPASDDIAIGTTQDQTVTVTGFVRHEGDAFELFNNDTVALQVRDGTFADSIEITGAGSGGFLNLFAGGGLGPAGDPPTDTLSDGETGYFIDQTIILDGVQTQVTRGTGDRGQTMRVKGSGEGDRENLEFTDVTIRDTVDDGLVTNLALMGGGDDTDTIMNLKLESDVVITDTPGGTGQGASDFDLGDVLPVGGDRTLIIDGPGTTPGLETWTGTAWGRIGDGDGVGDKVDVQIQGGSTLIVAESGAIDAEADVLLVDGGNLGIRESGAMDPPSINPASSGGIFFSNLGDTTLTSALTNPGNIGILAVASNDTETVALSIAGYSDTADDLLTLNEVEDPTTQGVIFTQTSTINAQVQPRGPTGSGEPHNLGVTGGATVTIAGTVRGHSDTGNSHAMSFYVEGGSELHFGPTVQGSGGPDSGSVVPPSGTVLDSVASYDGSDDAANAQSVGFFGEGAGSVVTFDLDFVADADGTSIDPDSPPTNQEDAKAWWGAEVGNVKVVFEKQAQLPVHRLEFDNQSGGLVQLKDDPSMGGTQSYVYQGEISTGDATGTLETQVDLTQTIDPTQHVFHVGQLGIGDGTLVKTGPGTWTHEGTEFFESVFVSDGGTPDDPADDVFEWQSTAAGTLQIDEGTMVFNTPAVLPDNTGAGDPDDAYPDFEAEIDYRNAGITVGAAGTVNVNRDMQLGRLVVNGAGSFNVNAANTVTVHEAVGGSGTVDTAGNHIVLGVPGGGEEDPFRLVPGASIGTLNVTGDLDIQSDDLRYEWEVGSGGADAIQVTGSFDMAASATPVLMVRKAGGDVAPGDYDLITWSGTDPTNPNAWTVDASTFVNTGPDCNWTDGTGSWDVPANWDLISVAHTGVVYVNATDASPGGKLVVQDFALGDLSPQVGSNVFIQNDDAEGSAFTVAGPAAAATVANLTLGGGTDQPTLDLAGAGTLDVTGVTTVQSGATLNVGAKLTTGDFQVTGGQVNLTGADIETDTGQVVGGTVDTAARKVSANEVFEVGIINVDVTASPNSVGVTGADIVSERTLTVGGGTVAISADPLIPGAEGKHWKNVGGHLVESVPVEEDPDDITIDPVIDFPDPGSGNELFVSVHPELTGYVTDHGSEWVGAFMATVAGEYEFFTQSDDGSTVEVDGELVVDNNLGQGFAGSEKGATKGLSTGIHTIRVLHKQGIHGHGIVVRWDPPTGEKELMPLFRLGAGAGDAIDSSNTHLVVSETTTVDLAASGPDGAVLGNLNVQAGTTTLETASKVTFNDVSMADGTKLVHDMEVTVGGTFSIGSTAAKAGFGSLTVGTQDHGPGSVLNVDEGTVALGGNAGTPAVAGVAADTPLTLNVTGFDGPAVVTLNADQDLGGLGLATGAGLVGLDLNDRVLRIYDLGVEANLASMLALDFLGNMEIGGDGIYDSQADGATESIGFTDQRVDAHGDPYVAVRTVFKGDITMNGTVGDEDFAVLLGNWGKAATWDSGDLSYNLTVGDEDFAVLLGHWGRTNGNHVPEPATLALMGVGLLTTLLARRRRR